MSSVRLTCKTWNTLSKSESFTEMHIGKAAATMEDESRMIVMRDHNVYLTSVVVNENPSTKSLGELTCLDLQVKISQVYHCEGLLLCILKDDNRSVVWNPYLRQTGWIETRHSEGNHKYKYGIGYHNHKNRPCRSYKIVCIRFFSWYETYNFDSNLWSSHSLTISLNMWFHNRGVSLKGNTYWYVTNYSLGQSDYMVCFDFTIMRFGEFKDLPFRVPYKQLVTLSCVGNEKLSILFQSREAFVIDIWITNKIEEQKMSWNKLLSLDMGPLTYLRISDGCFFIELEKKVAIVVNEDREQRLDTVKIFGEDGYFRELDLGEPLDKKCWPLVCAYVPSLVQINLPERGKRKRQSD